MTDEILPVPTSNSSTTEIASSTITVETVTSLLESWIPLDLSEPWDNTGLLLGDRAGEVERVMTCLTLSATTVEEAIGRRADLVVSHHPLPFKPPAKINTDTQTGDLLWRLARGGVRVYSPHTAWDSARNGINDLIAARLGLANVEPLIAARSSGPDNERGAGRCGTLPQSLDLNQFASLTVAAIPHCRPRGVPARRPIARVGIGCGSGGSFLSAAQSKQCDVLLTGEATFHDCLAAEYSGVGLLMIGHFASERFAMEVLADRLRAALPRVQVWASETERDPVVPL